MKSRKFLAVMLSLVICLSMFSDGFIVFAQELADRAASEEAVEESAEELALAEETAEPAPAEFIEPEKTTEEENQEQEEPASEESEEAPAPEKEAAKEADFPAQVVPAEVSPMDDPDIPESADEEEKDYKFKVRVSSKNGSGITNGVTGTVFADYSGKVVIDDGTVSTSNVTGEVWMKNVASLGVPGERYFSRLIQTGMSPRDVSLSAVQMLFANLHTATIVGTVGDKSVSYAVVNGGSVIDATPSSEAAAREVWMGIFNADTISAVTAPTDDSYARLEAGSYIQVGASRLYFNELTIDNVTNIGSVAAAIRQAATLQNLTGKDVIENAAIVLMPNTVLSVGQSSVTLNKETRVTVDADGFDENELGAVLTALQNASGAEEMIRAVAGAVQQFSGALDGKTTNVTFEFGHVYGEPEWTWADDHSATALFTCLNDGESVKLNAEVTSQVTAATCTEAGFTVYTASVTSLDGKEYTTTLKVDGAPATGHNYTASYEWAENDTKCTATAICQNGCDVVVTETVDTTSETVRQATALHAGLVRYTAEFSNSLFTRQEKDVPTDRLDYKFAVEVSSRNQAGVEHAVTGTVYSDYHGELVIDEGTVNTSNFKAGVWMKNVASLGLAPNEERHYERSIQTGMAPREVSLDTVMMLFSGLQSGAEVIGHVDDLSVTYTVTKDGRMVKAIPGSTAEAAAVWAGIVNSENMTPGTGAENSYAFIPAGSYVWSGSQKLLLDTDLRIDNVTDIAVAVNAIKGAATLYSVEAISDTVFYLEKGTVLSVGESLVTLEREAKITVNINGGQNDFGAVLTELRDASGFENVARVVFGGVNTVVTAMDGRSTDVTFKFGHDYEEPIWTWSEDHKTAIALFVCKNNDAHTVTLVTDVTEEITEAGCETAGTATYTASVVLDGKTYTGTMTLPVAASGHSWNAVVYTWSDDYSTCTAQITCKNDPTHIVTEVANSTAEELVAMTAAREGQVVYTAIFKNNLFATQTETVTVPRKDYKFAVEVSSEDSNHNRNAVTGTVYADYTAELVIDDGKVNTGNVRVGLWMQNVASLGVTTERHFERELLLGGNGRDVALSTVKTLFSGLRFANIVGVVGESSVNYNVVNNGSKITGTPESTEAASAVWHGIVNSENMTAATGADDSRAILVKGSYVQVGTSKLNLTDTLTIDNVTDLSQVVAAVKEAATLETAEAVENAVIYFEAGSELGLGESVVTLNKEARITLDIAGYSESELAGTLAALQSATSVEGMIRTVFEAVSSLTTAMNGKTTTVVFEFGHKWDEPTYEWAEDSSTCTATRVCENNADHKETETVTAVVTTADASCETAGTKTYTATFENEAFAEQTKTEEIAATGHNWGEVVYTWSEDHSTCTATVVCRNDATHILTETVDSTSEETVAMTAIREGEIVYTAEFENELFEKQTETVKIPRKDYKFAVEVSSEDSNEKRNAVTGTVYADYTAELVIDDGKVNTSNVRVGLWMQNVASLGVTTERHYERSVETGLDPRDVDLNVVKTLFSGLRFANIVGVVDGNSVNYNVVNSGNKITGTPESEDAARTVWHGIVNSTNLTPATAETDDSYASVKAGSFIQAGTQKLKVDTDLDIDNVTDIANVVAAVRAAASLNSADAVEGLVIYLEKGTVLSLGQSSVTLNLDARITVDIGAFDEASFESVLEALKAAQNAESMIRTMFEAISTVTTAMNGKTTTVTFEFGHKWGEPEWTWSEDKSSATATFVCENNEAHTEEVTATVTSETTDATCEEAGKTVYTATVTFEGETYTDTEEVKINALGHDWNEPTYEWAEDNSSVTATRVCKRDESHVETETVGTTSEVTKEATCEEKGKTTYTAVFTNEAFETQVKEVEDIDALGHKWGEPEWTWTEDKSGAMATFVCENDETHTEEVAATVTSETTDATCEEAGKTVYTATVTFEGETYTDTEEVKIDALGHKWGEPEWNWSDDKSTATAFFTCENDRTHTKLVAATVTSETTAATCEAAGKTIFTATAVLDGKTYSATEEVVLPALGHDYGEPEWTWSEDKSSATAKFICGHDETHTEEVTATVTSETTAATCDTSGKTVYTATVTFEGETYTDTKEVTIEALGHDYGEPVWTWSKDYKVAAAVFTCRRDSSHILTISVATTEERTEPTCESDGVIKHTAKVTLEGKEYTDVFEIPIPAIGHDYSGEPAWIWAEDGSTAVARFTCKNDASHVMEVNAVVSAEVTEATCENDGHGTFTATVSFNGETYTSVKELTYPAIGHKWGEPVWTWADDYSSATATFICENDETHVKVENATITSGPGEDGTEYVATVEFEGKTYTDTKTDLYDFYLNKSETMILLKESETLILTSYTDDVTWESDNEKRATVDQNGKVSANYPGHVTITVKSNDGKHSASCVVLVLFNDVTKPADYFFTPVYWAVEQEPQITTGYTNSDGTLTGAFGPKDFCTRGQIVTFLWRAAGCPEVTPTAATTFKDVKKNMYYYKAVTWAASKGITTGYMASNGKPSGKFGPNDYCTRAQIVTFLYRYAGSPAVTPTAATTFKDVKKGIYYYNAVTWAAQSGITTGYSDNTGAPSGVFGSDDTCTRGQAVTFLYRYIEG